MADWLMYQSHNRYSNETYWYESQNWFVDQEQKVRQKAVDRMRRRRETSSG